MHQLSLQEAHIVDRLTNASSRDGMRTGPIHTFSSVGAESSSLDHIGGPCEARFRSLG
jgi:hypothetical protein